MARPDTYEQWVKDGEADEKLATIQSLAMQGLPANIIAQKIKISTRTFFDMKRKHRAVAEALRKGRDAVVALLQSKLMERVVAGDTTAIIYGLKVYGGEFFRDRTLRVNAEITGKDGGALDFNCAPIIYVPDLPQLSDKCCEGSDAFAWLEKKLVGLCSDGVWR